MLSSTVVDGEKSSILEYSGLMMNFGRKVTSGVKRGRGGGGSTVGGKFSG